MHLVKANRRQKKNMETIFEFDKLLYDCIPHHYRGHKVVTQRTPGQSERPIQRVADQAAVNAFFRLNQPNCNSNVMGERTARLYALEKSTRAMAFKAFIVHAQ